jgi:hypothetical protein
MTLNQIVDRIRQLSLSHLQINSFYFGRQTDFDANEIVYPAAFLEQQAGSIDRAERQQRFNFRLYLLDLVPESTHSGENETEVLSDMSSVAADMLALMMKPEYQFDWEISDQSNITPVTQTLNDLDAGVFLDIEISVDFIADACQVPATDVNPNNDFDMARTRILTYEGTGIEGDSFNAGIAGKIVLAIFRAGQYRRGITAVPTQSDKIQVVGTDLGERKGILSTTGVVSLQVNDGLMEGEILDFLIYE